MPNNHSHYLLDIAKVGSAAIAATTITMVDINTYLTTVSVLIAIFYTIWKWCNDIKRNK